MKSRKAVHVLVSQLDAESKQIHHGMSRNFK